jgi:hypothetical protein
MMMETMLGGRVVYVHCKAGRSRAWCVAMCFLLTQRGMRFDQASQFLQKVRPCMTGSAMHALYVQQVVEYAESHPLPPVQPPKNSPVRGSKALDQQQQQQQAALPMAEAAEGEGRGRATSELEELARQRTQENDEKYKMLLADLLQLPAVYRVLILEDLQRLT